MKFCSSCGTANDETALFCENCGIKLNQTTTIPNQSPQYSTSDNNYSQVPKPYYVKQNPANNTYSTDPRPYYVKQNYPNSNSAYYNAREIQRTSELTIVLILLYIEVGILGILTIALFVVSPLIGFIFFLISGLFFWLVYSVQQYNNAARIIMIILLVLGLIGSLSNFIPLIIYIIEIYVLTFHQPTVNLFTKEIPMSNRNYTYNYNTRRY